MSDEMAAPSQELDAKIKQAAEGASQAAGAGIGELKGSLIELGGQVPGLEAVVDEWRPVGASKTESGDIPQLRPPAEIDRERDQNEADPAAPALAESLTATGALQAAAEQVKAGRGADADGQAALAQALRTFLDALAGQSAPTRSEFRDLAARLDRLSSQYAKGR